MKEQQLAWWALYPDDVLSRLDSGLSGISRQEAKKRLARFGPNELAEKRGPPPVILFLRQFMSPLIYILLAAVFISAFTGHFLDAAAIMFVLIINALIGFIQETRAEKAMKALLEMAAPKTLDRTFCT